MKIPDKIGTAFIGDLLADWEQNGKMAIERVRKERPETYLRIVAAVTPKQLDVDNDPISQMSDAELEEILKEFRDVVDQNETSGAEG